MSQGAGGPRPGEDRGEGGQGHPTAHHHSGNPQVQVGQGDCRLVLEVHGKHMLDTRYTPLSQMHDGGRVVKQFLVCVIYTREWWTHGKVNENKQLLDKF